MSSTQLLTRMPALLLGVTFLVSAAPGRGGDVSDPGAKTSTLRTGTSSTPTIPGAADPAWSPDGKTIAFVGYPRSGPRALYVMRLDGSGLRRLTGGRSGHAGWPSWSPDGKRLALESGVGISVVNVDGTRLRRIVASFASWPDWGPGGKRIAFGNGPDSQSDVHVVSPDGSGRETVAQSDTNHSFDEPTWSPRGRELAFFAREAPDLGLEVETFLGAVSSYLGKVRRVRAGHAEAPDWSPRGGKIAFTEVTFDPTDFTLSAKIGVVNLKTGVSTLLHSGWHARWSPDGRRLVFVDGTYNPPDRSSRIYVMNADGSNVTPLTG